MGTNDFWSGISQGLGSSLENYARQQSQSQQQMPQSWSQWHPVGESPECSDCVATPYEEPKRILLRLREEIDRWHGDILKS